MAKFKLKQKALKASADTSDLTGVHVELHWKIKRGVGGDGKPTETRFPVLHFVLPDDSAFEARPADEAALLTLLGAEMKTALTAHPDYESA